MKRTNEATAREIIKACKNGLLSWEDVAKKAILALADTWKEDLDDLFSLPEEDEFTESKKVNETRAFDLVGVDGNAFSVMGYVLNAMRKARLSKAEQDAYKKDAMSSDYNNLLAVSVDMIDRCNQELGLDCEDEDEYDYESLDRRISHLEQHVLFNH